MLRRFSRTTHWLLAHWLLARTVRALPAVQGQLQGDVTARADVKTMARHGNVVRPEEVEIHA